jgi:hypothetical protein
MREKEPDLSKWLTGGRTRADVDLENRYHRGKAQALGYRQWALANADKWRILEYLPGEPAVEVPFELTLNGVTVIGYIDQIIEWSDGQVTARDLKTGNKLPTSPRQLGIYGLAIHDNLGIPVGYADYWMGKNNDVTAPYDLSRYTPERIGRWFKAMDNAVRRNEFIANPGDACRVCGVARFCDLLGAEAHLYPYEGLTDEVA